MSLDPDSQGAQKPAKRRTYLSPFKYLDVLECLAAIILARAGLHCMRLDPLATAGCRMFGRLRSRRAVPSPLHVRLLAVRVERVSRLLPGTVCLPQALAIHWLLARRRAACTLHIGIAKDPSGFRSHAWSTAGGRVILGGTQAPMLYREIVRVEPCGALLHSAASKRSECQSSDTAAFGKQR